jgi:hypothetical protein
MTKEQWKWMRASVALMAAAAAKMTHMPVEKIGL